MKFIKLHNALILTLIANTLITWGKPTLQPYNVKNDAQRNAVLALYKTAKGLKNEQETSIPLVLEEASSSQGANTPMGTSQASIFVDDNNAIIGLIIYKDTIIQDAENHNRPISFIKNLIMTPNQTRHAQDLLAEFEQSKRTENCTQINVDITGLDQNLFKRAGFKKIKKSDSSMWAKCISPSRTSCCIQ